MNNILVKQIIRIFAWAYGKNNQPILNGLYIRITIKI